MQSTDREPARKRRTWIWVVLLLLFVVGVFAAVAIVFFLYDVLWQNVLGGTGVLPQ